MVTSTKVNRSNTPRKPANIPKKPAKPNASILSFFQKTQKQEDSLFVGSDPGTGIADDDIYSGQDLRFNEFESPVKKPRLCEEQLAVTVHDNATKSTVEPASNKNPRDNKRRSRIGLPFVVDSDSEDEEEADAAPIEKDAPDFESKSITPAPFAENFPLEPDKTALNLKLEVDDEVRLLERQDSTYQRFDQIDNSGELQDLAFDEIEGEEMREKKYMWEQARLEAEEEGSLLGEDFADDPPDGSGTAETCPICSGSLAGVSTDDATRHVNSCLDGNPIPLPAQDKSSSAEPPEVDSVDMSKRFARAAVPRPPQANPFDQNNNGKGSRSAFSKLMSNNAEDSAWATAAAAEHASRGRPAYERTCPFYKIMPGFNICVDAFRYGAVQGCEAYFLSHFHSDHYIGLTANWRHGPIYCSKVTGSLVKQQLRTASKWVVELEFDRSYDVPGTGASVTMIPANHCPGSSLFLFQKPLGAAHKGGMRRILHCGDFRACPEHVGHPLLKPDVVDAITSKGRPQTIDICYLDTTYLNPRYSFPPQDEVIKACADLCASMSPDPNCKDDIWEHSAQASGTQTMSKYFHSSKAVDEGTRASNDNNKKEGQRLLVICGTYSIGKERICVAIAKALNSKIFVTPGKMKICKQLRDPELAALLTSNPVEAQVHMQSLMEIRAETLKDYLASYRPHFSRIVGFRPSGWTFRPGDGKVMGANTPPSSVPTQQILHGKGWRTRFGYKDLAAQRGSTKEAMCFGVPYSEHSSFRELAIFVMSLRIEKVIPTVNVGSEQSRKRMKGWIDRWMAERKRCGLVRPLIEGVDDENGTEVELWEGKAAQGGGAWW